MLLLPSKHEDHHHQGEKRLTSAHHQWQEDFATVPSIMDYSEWYFRRGMNGSTIFMNDSDVVNPYDPMYWGGDSGGGGGGNITINFNPYRPCVNFTNLFFNSSLSPRHGCIIEENTLIPFCQMEHLQIDVSKIILPMGGENLTTVMGREEDAEYPVYLPGAFIISKPLEFVKPFWFSRSTFHYIQNVLYAVMMENETTIASTNETTTTTIEIPSQRRPRRNYTCTKTWTGPTLFITRYEYVNLYHTMTDFFNTFLSLPADYKTNDDVDDQKVNIVFLDAHAQGNLDPVWQQVFGKFHFVKQLRRSFLPEEEEEDKEAEGDVDDGGVICFQRAIFVPPGYVSPLIYVEEREPVCPIPRMMEDFAMRFLKAYKLEHVKMKRGMVVVIERVPYIAHPRSIPNYAERIVDNMKRIAAHVRQLPQVKKVVMARFEQLSFRQQLKLVREAHILLGNHGAGLTHMVFMSDGSHVVELDEDRPFFITLARWKPNVQHHPLSPVGEHATYEYIRTEVLPKITQILTNDTITTNNNTTIGGADGANSGLPTSIS